MVGALENTFIHSYDTSTYGSKHGSIWSSTYLVGTGEEEKRERDTRDPSHEPEGGDGLPQYGRPGTHDTAEMVSTHERGRGGKRMSYEIPTVSTCTHTHRSALLVPASKRELATTDGIWSVW